MEIITWNCHNHFIKHKAIKETQSQRLVTDPRTHHTMQETSIKPIIFQELVKFNNVTKTHANGEGSIKRAMRLGLEMVS